MARDERRIDPVVLLEELEMVDRELKQNQYRNNFLKVLGWRASEDWSS